MAPWAKKVAAFCLEGYDRRESRVAVADKGGGERCGRSISAISHTVAVVEANEGLQDGHRSNMTAIGCIAHFLDKEASLLIRRAGPGGLVDSSTPLRRALRSTLGASHGPIGVDAAAWATNERKVRIWANALTRSTL